MFGGGAVVELIIQYHRTQPALACKYTFEDLDKGTPWLGDERMDEFLQIWHRITSELSYDVPARLLLELFLERCRYSKALAMDIILFDTPDRSSRPQH